MEDNTESSDPLIVSVKPPNKIIEELLPGYENEYCDVPEKNTNDTFCWNCVKKIETEVNIPLKYENGSFYVYGSFCCFGCAARYLLDTYHNQEMWDKYVLLNYYYNTVFHTKGKNVEPVPDKRLLRIFGGEMSHTEYHSESSKNIGMISIPPVFVVDHVVHGNDSRYKTQDDGKSELKLFRKKPIKKHTILDKLSDTKNKSSKEIHISINIE